MNGKLTEQEIFEQYHLQKSDFSSEDEYFLAVAAEIGKTSTCNRGNCWCLLVQKGEIIAFGAADVPQGSPTCQEVWHKMWHVIHEDGRETDHCMRNNCAEQVAISSAAKHGYALDGATMYVTMTPCSIRHCAHITVACGIKKVVCSKRYHDYHDSEEIFKNAGVELIYLDDHIECY